MNATKPEVRDGIYIIAPDGCAWSGYRVRNGRVIDGIEESMHSNAVNANDSAQHLYPDEDHDQVVDDDTEARAFLKLIGSDMPIEELYLSWRPWRE